MLKINIENKVYKNKSILYNLKIESHKPELICLIGPSGCGKTTLLKIVASLDEEYEGSVLYNQKNSIDNLGFIFQDTRLLPWLSVKQNIMLVSRVKDEKKVEILLKEVGLGEYINAYIKELSGGMKRRVSIVRAFINQPEVLLLDEPFISLDYPNAQSLRRLFFKFYQDYSPTVLFVTHDLNEALALSDRILFLSSNPSSIIYEYKNTPCFDEKVIRVKKEEVLNRYPQILSGII